VLCTPTELRTRASIGHLNDKINLLLDWSKQRQIELPRSSVNIPAAAQEFLKEYEAIAMKNCQHSNSKKGKESGENYCSTPRRSSFLYILTSYLYSLIPRL
jgi:hypothetical protein